jgi:hypothetical protein
MSWFGVRQPSSGSRLLFPFIATALRCFRAISPFESVVERNNNLGISSKLCNDLALNEADLCACRFIKACMDIDLEAKTMHTLTDLGEDLLLSLRRSDYQCLCIEF